jgi:hypothetical protein
VEPNVTGFPSVRASRPDGFEVGKVFTVPRPGVLEEIVIDFGQGEFTIFSDGSYE